MVCSCSVVAIFAMLVVVGVPAQASEVATPEQASETSEQQNGPLGYYGGGVAIGAKAGCSAQAGWGW